MNFSIQDFSLKDVDIVYFCSGGRNHKLKEAFLKTDIRYELDERSASYKALGAAKAGKLAAVCVTSGTAVAQCLPAMIEANYAGLPFILISGDRPERLIGTAAPQTIDHFGVTKSYARKQLQILDTEFAELKVASATFPLHLNVLVDERHELKNTAKKARTEDLQSFLDRFEKTLFLVSHANTSMRKVVESLVEKTDYVYAETLSGAKDLSPIANEWELMKMFKAGEFDSVVRVGHTPLSKLWRVIDTVDIPVFSVDPRGLAGLSRGEVLTESPEVIYEFAIKANRHESAFNWEPLERFPNSQMAWMKKFQKTIPENSAVYLGNSSAIRDFEAVQTKRFRTYGNRGANGIDGQLSTAVGLAQSVEETVYCLLGDLTFLYDIGASFDLPENLKVIVLDNDGGRIFERIGIRDEILLSGRPWRDGVKLHKNVEVVKISSEETLACFREMAR